MVNITTKITITKITAAIGAKRDKMVTTKAVPVSTADIMGFANPPVVAVDANLLVAEAPLMAVAVPPPAMMAKVQVIKGSKSATVETITAVPAIPAKGMAKLSKRLSTQGIKYAKISMMVATPKTISAERLDIHSQLELRSQAPK